MTYWVDMLGCEVRYLEGRHRTRVITLGTGMPMVLLHGTGGHAENFCRNIEQYATRYRVIAIDMLWHGYSDSYDFQSDVIPPLVQHVLEVLDMLDIDRAILEGQSLGGWVAATLAAAHPERVLALVLTTPMGVRPDDPAVSEHVDWQRLRESNIATLRDPTSDNVRRRLERIVFDPSVVTDEAVAVRHKIYNRPGFADTQIRLMEAYLGGGAVKRHEITREVAQRISVPTLVYWGANNLVSEATGRWLADQIPDAQFYCAPKTGHWAQFENAEEHNRVVLNFLASCLSRRQSKGAAE